MRPPLPDHVAMSTTGSRFDWVNTTVGRRSSIAPPAAPVVADSRRSV